ncbi:MAG: glycosyltransferase family 4 protein [Chloroflexi bacterium]|nr:glycosyltransferase family 4 protein [Chloroflexota bacterium]
MSARRIPVELVEFGAGDAATGIGRYASAIGDALQRHTESVDPCHRRFQSLPGANRVQTLRHLPVGIAGRRPGSIVHLMQIMGSALLRYRSIHPSVVTVHDLGMLVSHEDDSLFTPLGRTLMKQQFLGLRRADRLVAVSAFTAHTLQESLAVPRDRIRVIFHGVDAAYRERPSAADPAVLDRYRPPRTPGVFDLLYVGSELPRKNLATLLNAVAILKARGQPVRLIKAGGAGGDRWRQATVQMISALGLDGDVVFTGRVDEAHLPLLYRVSDVFVTTSRLEGFGLPAAEAMASGTPVICSDAGSLPEIVGDAGLLVNADEPEAVAAAILRLRDDISLRTSLVERGLQRAALYTWERTAAELADLYTEIAPTEGARSSR